MHTARYRYELGLNRMYHPYFRGKQYELITIWETAELLVASNLEERKGSEIPSARARISGGRKCGAAIVKRVLG